MKAFGAQVRAELYMTLRRGETLLLTVGIPVIFLVFFSTVHVVSVPARHSVDFFVPGILSLAVMSTALVSLGIASGFERGYGVLKRLQSTPLGRPRLISAKIATVVVVEIVQGVILIPVGVGLGWKPGTLTLSAHQALGTSSSLVASFETVGLVLLATCGFAGLGLFMAGRLRAEVNLASANGLYLVLLLLGGMIVPIGSLPGALGAVAKVLPPEALSSGLQAALGAQAAVPVHSWVVLGIWAVLTPLAAMATFRWE